MVLIFLKCVTYSNPDKNFQLIDELPILLSWVLGLWGIGELRVFGSNFVVHFFDIKDRDAWDFVFEDIVLFDTFFKVVFVFFLVDELSDKWFEDRVLIHGFESGDSVESGN